MSDPKNPQPGQVWRNGTRRRVLDVRKEPFVDQIASVLWQNLPSGAPRRAPIRGWLDWARGATLEVSDE